MRRTLGLAAFYVIGLPLLALAIAFVATPEAVINTYRHFTERPGVEMTLDVTKVEGRMVTATRADVDNSEPHVYLLDEGLNVQPGNGQRLRVLEATIDMASSRITEVMPSIPTATP